MSNQFQMGNNKASKLTGEQVVEILERYATERGMSQPRLAREYGVSVNTIAKILNGTSHRHITRPGQTPGLQPEQVYRPPINMPAPTNFPPAEELLARLHKRMEGMAADQAARKTAASSLYDNYRAPTENEDKSLESISQRMNDDIASGKVSLDGGGQGGLKQQDVNQELDKLIKGD
jgi:transcriptional regulator with XRE-family HTH domain